MKPTLFPTLSCLLFALTACHATKGLADTDVSDAQSTVHEPPANKRLTYPAFLTYLKGKLDSIKLLESSPAVRFFFILRKKRKLKLDNTMKFLTIFDHVLNLNLDVAAQLQKHSYSRETLDPQLFTYLLSMLSFYNILFLVPLFLIYLASRKIY